jgi:hypothetical protein
LDYNIVIAMVVDFLVWIARSSCRDPLSFFLSTHISDQTIGDQFMKSISACLSWLVLTLIFISFGSVSLAQDLIPKEAIDGWREMSKIAEQVQFTFRMVDKNELTGKVEAEEFACAIQGDKYKTEFINNKRGRWDRVVLWNGNGFALGRNEGGGWQLKGIAEPGEIIPDLENTCSRAREGFELHGSATLLQVPDNKRFEVSYWRDSNDGSGNIETKIRDNELKCELRLTLQPERRFRVLSAVGVDDGDPTEGHWVHEYSDKSILTEVIPSRTYLKNSDLQVTLLSIDNKLLPESDFMLSSYGIPDYVKPSNNTNWWLFFLLIAIVITAIVFWKTSSKN